MTPERFVLDGQALFEAASKFSLTGMRRTNWTPKRLSALMCLLQPVFEQTHPVAVLARIGLYPNTEKEKTPPNALLNLHFQVVHPIQDLGKHPSYVYERFTVIARSRLGLGSDVLFGIHSTHTPEHLYGLRITSYIEKGYTQVYPAQNFDGKASN